MAARICHPLGHFYCFPMGFGQLREAVIPCGIGTVCGGCIDKPGTVIVTQRNRFPCRRIRQAQEYDIRCIDELFPFRCILALVLVNENQINIITGAKAFKNLQTRGSLFAVYVNNRLHGSPPVSYVRRPARISASCSSASARKVSILPI